MTLLMASNIVLEAFVSFLNFGIAPTEATWGNALSNSQGAMGAGNWWWAFFPGMCYCPDGDLDQLHRRWTARRT